MIRRQMYFWPLAAAARSGTARRDPDSRGKPPARPRRPGVVALRGGTVLTVTQGHDSERHRDPARRQDRRGRRQRARFPPAPRSSTPRASSCRPASSTRTRTSPTTRSTRAATTVSSMTGMEDVLDPTDINIYRDLAGGLTVANILHGSANPIGGKNQVIKLRWGKTRAEEIVFEGAMPGIKFALGENPKDMPIGQRDRPAPLPDDAHGRRVRHPRRVHARQGVPEGVEGLREEQGASAGRAAAAPRPAARAARRDPRGQAPRARALLPRRRDPDDDPARRGDGLQDRDLPARARGLQGRQGDRRARRRRLDVLRLVGLQDRGGRRDSRTTPRSWCARACSSRSTPTAPSTRAASTPRRPRR